MGKDDLPPYVKPERDRQGRIVYFYFRRHGQRWRLPGKPHSAEFAAEWARLKAKTDPVPTPEDAPETPPPKSVGALALDYYSSPAFRNRKPSTQAIYRRFIEDLVARYKAHPVALIERHHVKKWRDERADTPGMANLCLSVVRLLLTYAVKNNYRKDNPAIGLEEYTLGEHRAWTPEELAAYERHWSPGTIQRRAYALARYTGQRRSDVAAMTRAHRVNGFIRVKQVKTSTELQVPEHKELTAELARGDQQHMSLLVTVTGKAYSADRLGVDFAAWIQAAGLPEECVLHGLRKVAARDLADAGCSTHEIMSITGHKSLSEVERYTKAADQRRLASAAIFKLERSGDGAPAESGKRPSGGSGKQKPKH